MSTVRIKHWGRKLGPLPLGKCSAPNCQRQGEDVENGKVVCGRHLTLSLSTVAALRPGQRIGR